MLLATPQSTPPLPAPAPFLPPPVRPRPYGLFLLRATRWRPRGVGMEWMGDGGGLKVGVGDSKATPPIITVSSLDSQHDSHAEQPFLGEPDGRPDCQPSQRTPAAVPPVFTTPSYTTPDIGLRLMTTIDQLSAACLPPACRLPRPALVLLIIRGPIQG